MKAEVLQHARLELVDLARIATEQGKLVELRADRALQAAHRIAPEELLDPCVRQQQFLAEHREALAERGRLRGHVVRAPGDHQVAVRLRLPSKREQGSG